MKENITELKTKLKSQNRIKLFSSPNNHHFLYDAFSQNIYLHTAFKKGHWSVEKGTIGAQKRTA